MELWPVESLESLDLIFLKFRGSLLCFCISVDEGESGGVVQQVTL